MAAIISRSNLFQATPTSDKLHATPQSLCESKIRVPILLEPDKKNQKKKKTTQTSYMSKLKILLTARRDFIKSLSIRFEGIRSVTTDSSAFLHSIWELLNV